MPFSSFQSCGLDGGCCSAFYRLVKRLVGILYLERDIVNTVAVLLDMLGGGVVGD